MRKLILPLLLLPLLSFGQTSNFPGSVDTDAQLYVTADALQTQLTVAMAPGDAVAVVASTARWTANMIATVCDAQSSAGVCTAWEHMLVTSVVNANTLAVTRGINGTSGVAHSPGRNVSVLINSGHQKVLASAVKAIETALGPNLNNIPTPPLINSGNYIFAAQSCNAGLSCSPGGASGGALSAGANTVVMTPCPAGMVFGGVTGSLLYLSGGVGTAEPARVTGGILSGGSCSVIFTTANTHSGAWTIQSATAGIDLACGSSPLGAHVVIPPGNFTIWGSIRPTVGCTVDGQGFPSPNGPSGAVFLHEQIAAVPLIDVATFSVTVENLQLAYGTYPAYTVNGAAATAGSIGIQSGVTAAIDQPRVLNVLANNFYLNYNFASNAIYCDHVLSLGAVSHGFVIGALGSGYMLNVLAEGSGGDGYHLKAGSAALQWENVAGFANLGWGMYIEDGTAFQMDDLDFESDITGGISVGVTGVSAILQNVIIQDEGVSSFGGSNNNTAPGIQVRSSAFLSVSNAQLSSNQGNGIEILSGAGANIGGASYLYQNGGGLQANHTYNIYALGTASFRGLHTYYAPIFINATNNRLTGNYFTFPAGCPVAGGVQFGASATHTVFAENDVDCAGGGGVAINYTAGSTFKAASNHVSVGTTITGTPVSDFQTVYTYQLAQLAAPSTLTVAANAIAISLPIHHVGAGLIKNITFASGTPISVCLDLVADAAFTTDTTGNIVTPAITATIGKVYHGCFDGAKWYLTN